MRSPPESGWRHDVLLVTVRGMIFQLAPDTGHTAVPDDACSAVRVRVNIRNI